MNRTYTALNIAEYIIDIEHKQDITITESKLQNLLYYIQKEYIIQKNRKLFSEDIIRNNHGPIIHEVHDIYGKPFVSNVFSHPVYKIEIDQDDKNFINKIIAYYNSISNYDMFVNAIKEDIWSQNQPDCISITKMI